VLVTGAFISLYSCGYRFVGSTGEAPKGMHTIYVHMIENRTAEVGIEVILTDQLKNEFIRKYKGQLAPLEKADGILSGRITDVRTVTIARRSTQSSLEKRVTITIDLTLKNQDEEIIWSARGMSDSETFAVEQSDRQSTETAKRAAMEQVLLRLGETAYYRMTDDF
jgi:hypothetical protein